MKILRACDAKDCSGMIQYQSRNNGEGGLHGWCPVCARDFHLFGGFSSVVEHSGSDR